MHEVCDFSKLSKFAICFVISLGNTVASMIESDIISLGNIVAATEFPSDRISCDNGTFFIGGGGGRVAVYGYEYDYLLKPPPPQIWTPSAAPVNLSRNFCYRTAASIQST